MEESKYNPKDIQSPVEFVNPFCGTMGSMEWELVAAYLVLKSQINGNWTSIQEFYPDYDTQGMINKGLLIKNNSGFMLTKSAIEKLVAQCPAKK